MKTRHKIIFFSFLGLASLSVNAETVNLQIRDSHTNISIDANVELAQHKYHLNAFEPFQTNLPNGTYPVSISADGYNSMQTDIVVESNAPSEFKFMLDPKPSQRPPVKRQAMIDRNAVNVPTSNFYGYVVDGFGKPLAGVNVQAFESNLSTSTDERGYFSFDVPIPTDIENPTQTLIWSLPNHKTVRRSNVLLMNEAQGYKIELLDGKGQIDILENEKLLKNETPSIGQVTVSKQSALKVNAINATDGNPFGKPRSFIVPPSTIRVGVNCTGASCPTFVVLDFETYVATGLGSEWLPNWTANSLKAGAIAYRSYAANKVQSSKSKKFDICNTINCQVFDNAKIPTATVAQAVQETSGFMLTNDGKKPSLSEYASVTNGLPYPSTQTYYSNDEYCKKNGKQPNGNKCVKITTADLTATGCGDGFSGEPFYLKNVMSGGWWCLADSVQASMYHFGHGRGMSQTGSQNWAAQGKDWSWILWHYYQEKRTPPALNAAKSDPTPYQEISSPIDTSKNPPTVDKTTASTGETIKLNWKITNTSPIYNANVNTDSIQSQLQNLLLKASLELGKTSTTLTNSDNVGLNIGKGEKELSNSFTIPSTVASGQYKIKLQLWLDVNKNNKVDEGDTNTDLLLGENAKLDIKIESKGTGYTKIANDGSPLPDSAVLGTKPKDWACTKDNKTGLIWEVKTSDGGLRDRNNTYTWYNGDPATHNGYDLYCAIATHFCQSTINSDAKTVYSPSPFGNLPVRHLSSKPEDFIGYENNGQNTETYTTTVNVQGLCGATNWRLPTEKELDGFTININTTYFPDTKTRREMFWSSSPDADNSAWVVGFDYDLLGLSLYGIEDKSYDYHVRLVR